MRQEFSKPVRRDAFLRAKGNCEGCGLRLALGKFHFDHDLPDDLGGEPTLDNCRVLCVTCHKAKTKQVDIPRIAKGRRIRDREMGIKKRSSFACSKTSRWKKKVTGEIVLR